MAHDELLRKELEHIALDLEVREVDAGHAVLLRHERGELVLVEVTELRELGAEASTDGGQESLSADVVVAHYVQGLRRLPEALAQAPSLMTNYLLNDMFREAFPFADGAPFAQYQRLLVRFGMVRLLLVARCNAAGAGLPSAQDLAATVQVFCRRHQHDPSFARALDQVLANAGWDRLDRLWRFLKT